MAVIERASQPSIRSDSATALALRGLLDDEMEIAIATCERRSDRPEGRRFGTLVHAILAEVALDADDVAGIAAMAELCGKLVGATDEEVEAAKRAVADALAHPLMERAAAAEARGECRREVPLFLALGDGTIVDGIADLAFSEAEGEGRRWVVVDYKTDSDVGDHAEYRAQVGLYVRAIAAATGEPTTGILFAV
jgi:ATP-dependent exoDNAse (exonuclease V) beta subunit